MSATAAPPDKHHGLPTGAKLLIAFLAAVAVIAVAVAIFAGRSTTTAVRPPAPVTPPVEVIPPTTTVASPPTPAPATSAPVVATNVANGCLGGSGELDQAVLAAQKTAPITPVGAAEFAATVVRWAETSPAPSQQASLAATLLTATATQNARAELSNTIAAERAGYTVTLNFSAGHYIVSAFAGDTATVKWQAALTGTHNGVSAGPAANYGGAVTLNGQSGVWRLQDSLGKTSESAADAASFLSTVIQSGTAYAGGC